MTPIRAATSFSALAHKTSVSLTHQPMSTIKAQQQQQQAKSVLVPPPTPTQQLQDRLRSLNATPVASPAVKLGRKLQTMRYSNFLHCTFLKKAFIQLAFSSC